MSHYWSYYTVEYLKFQFVFSPFLAKLHLCWWFVLGVTISCECTANTYTFYKFLQKLIRIMCSLEFVFLRWQMIQFHSYQLSESHEWKNQQLHAMTTCPLTSEQNSMGQRTSEYCTNPYDFFHVIWMLRANSNQFVRFHANFLRKYIIAPRIHLLIFVDCFLLFHHSVFDPIHYPIWAK